ncbi:MAG TPA: hypothetical protein VGG33_03390 [Polyangia bacterium]
MRALLAKEWSQHARALVTLSIFFALVGLAAWATFLQSTRSVSVLEIVPRLAISALPAAAVVLGHRLVILEYYGRTQRFLEALPLRRGEEVTIKFAFGLFWLLLWGALALTIAIVVARRTVPIDVRFAAILALRLAGYTTALWSVVFVFHVFGRLRVPLLLLAVLVAVLVSNARDVSLRQSGPMRLVDASTYVIESAAFPSRDLVLAFGIAAAGAVLALLLVSLREGGVVEALAKPLSTREKGALLVVVMGGAIAAASVEKEKVAPMPELDAESVIRGPSPQLGDRLEVVYAGDALRPAAERLVGLLAPALGRLEEVLPKPARRLRVIHGGDVLPDRSELVARYASGSVIRINLQSFLGGDDVAETLEARTRTLADVFHVVLVSASEGRALLEPRHFWTDGFAQYLASRALPPTETPPLEALLAHHETGGDAPNEGTIRYHHSFGEQVGEARAMVLAGDAWSYLHDRSGEAKVFALAKALFSRRSRGDLRDLVHERLHPPTAVFTEVTGLPFSSFVTDWRRRLADQAKAPAQAASLEVRPRAVIDVVPQPAAAFDPIVIEGRFASPLDPQATCQALHMVERWFDSWPSPEELQIETINVASDRRGFRHALDGDYESGERAFVAVDCRLPTLPGRTRLHAERVTVP